MMRKILALLGLASFCNSETRSYKKNTTSKKPYYIQTTKNGRKIKVYK